METVTRPLGTVAQLLEELGHEISYAYDDLIFVNENDFLLQFSNTGHVLNLFFNKSCTKQSADHIEQSVIPAADKMGLSIVTKGLYSVTGDEDEQLRIEFFNN